MQGDLRDDPRGRRRGGRRLTALLARPASLDEAIRRLAADPDAVLLAGGTDLMLALNAGRLRPRSLLALGGVTELAGWHNDELGIWLGAGLTFAELRHEPLATLTPALGQVARTLGPPQVRNAATLGGSLGTAASDGDALPVLAALDALILVQSSAGPRKVPVREFLVEPGRTALRAGELIAGAWLPAMRGPQEFCAVRSQSRRTLVAVALAGDVDARQVRCAVGAVTPVPVRDRVAEAFIADQIDWATGRVTDPAAYEEFGRLVAKAAGSGETVTSYSRHAVAVCARRALARAFPLGPA